MPQVHTIIDFCRLLQQEECRTIVMLNSGFTDTQVHVRFRVCYSVIIIIPYKKNDYKLITQTNYRRPMSTYEDAQPFRL